MIDLLAVTEPRLAYLTLGGFVVVFSLFSLFIREKLYISEVVICTVFGVIIGPYCADIFDPRGWASDDREITLEVMRVVLGTGLFAIGVELPEAYMGNHIPGLFMLVIPTMAIGWFIVSGFMLLLFPALSFVSCLVIAACLTPTDPVISAAIVGNGKYAREHVAGHLRHIISAESAANDGLAYPFLSLSIFLTIEATKGEAFKKWILVGCLYQVVLGTIFGATVGYVFSKLLAFCHGKYLADNHSFLIQYLALAFFTIGAASALGIDDLLAAFAAGCAIAWDGKFKEETDNESFAAIVDLLLNSVCFIYIGAWLDFRAFDDPLLGITPWKLVVLFIWIAVFRRIPAILMLYNWVPEIKTWQQALFAGHFGPMGVGAIFVSTLALSELKVPHNPPQDQEELLAATLQVIVSFVVFCSIFIHGLSIPIFAACCRTHPRVVSRIKTWTSTDNGWAQTRVGRMNLSLSGWFTAETILQPGIGHDEESVDHSEVHTRVDEISETNENGKSTTAKEDARITGVSWDFDESFTPRSDGQDGPSRSGPAMVGQPGGVASSHPVE